MKKNQELLLTAAIVAFFIVPPYLRARQEAQRAIDILNKVKKDGEQ